MRGSDATALTLRQKGIVWQQAVEVWKIEGDTRLALEPPATLRLAPSSLPQACCHEALKASSEESADGPRCIVDPQLSEARPT